MKERNVKLMRNNVSNSTDDHEGNFEGNEELERNFEGNDEQERNSEGNKFESERNNEEHTEVPKKFKTSKIPKLRCRDFIVQKFPQFIQKFQPKDASVLC